MISLNGIYNEMQPVLVKTEFTRKLKCAVLFLLSIVMCNVSYAKGMYSLYKLCRPNGTYFQLGRYISRFFLEFGYKMSP